MQSLKYSFERFGLAALLSLVVFHASCGNVTQDPGSVGVIRAAVTSVPADVACIRIEVQGARFTSQDFDVTPGMDTTLLMTGVSTGSVVVTVKGFTGACASLTPTSTPAWISDPASAFVGTAGATDVSVVMHRNGQISVGIDFQDDPVCGADGGFCAPATCTDGARNGMETDQDCGGGTCPRCRHGGRCNVATDCGSLFCDRGRCAPTCGNGVQDGTETGVDCGGECGICNGGACSTGAECASQICTNGVCVANGPSCTDGVQNGMETDLDCGGPCPPCADGNCHDGSDCASGACVAGRCRASCIDGVKNGTETDVDCGGGCSPCADGRMCLVNTDCNVICENGVCTTKQCLPIGTGVTAFWKANDDFVESIGGLATFPVGNVTFAPGITGSGFFLDGPGTFVDVPTAPALDLATGLTIDAWINPTDANGGNGRIVDKIAPFGSDGYLLDLIGGHLRGIVGGEGIQTGETVLPNRFTHVALTFEPGAVMTLFIDGRPAAAAPIFQTAVPTNNHPVLFGADQGGGSNFAGVIDNVRLWNNAVDQRSVGLLPGQGRNCP